ncbi:MAG: hypothetical protein M3Q58_02725 [Bacteroidota bacterium]|nr:hypothetical protein [Bacteroidota bacterium]
MTKQNEKFHYNSALIIDPEITDLFICSKMFFLKKVAKDVYTRKNINSAITLINKMENPVDIIVIDFLSNDLIKFLQKFGKLPEKQTKNIKVFILSALLEYYPGVINEALRFKNVVMTMDKPMSEENMKTIISLKDNVRLA